MRRQQEHHLAASSVVDTPRRNWRQWCIGLLIVSLTLAVYWQVTHFELTDIDDPDYVINNTRVRQGLNWENVQWCFNIGYAANWHPMTWLTHMLDCELFGMETGKLLGTGGHHLTSLLLHAGSSVLLFLVLQAMTGASWRSGFVAGLFALHPLHVESVAWVAERKDVLSTFFMLLTFWAYQRYVRIGQGESSRRGAAPLFYLLALFFFALGLMSKQMLVSVPFLLLFCDIWPLQRWPAEGKKRRGLGGKLVLEKIPFLALAALAAILVIAAQGKGGAITSAQRISIGDRISNAVVTYVVYLVDMVWPQRLGHYYPHEGVDWAGWQVAGSALFLGVISWLALRYWQKCRFFAVGWFWYLLTLVPVIGLVQLGAQARADRYTYVPSIGIFIIVAFGGPMLLARWAKWQRPVLAVAGMGVTAALIPVTYAQIGYWENSEKLYAHTLTVTRNNWFVHNAMAAILNSQATVLRLNGKVAEARQKNEEAVRHLRVTLELMPRMVDAHTCLANALLELEQVDEAIAEYEIALKLNPRDVLSHANLANALLKKNRVDEAIEHCEASLSVDPSRANSHYNLAVALERKGELEGALSEYQKTVELFPGDLVGYWAHYQMGALLGRLGRTSQAIESLSKAVEINARSRVDQSQEIARRELERLSSRR